MIKVAIYGIKGEYPTTMLEKLVRQMPGSKPTLGNIEIVTNTEEADYYLIIQSDSLATKDLTKDKKVFIQREPEVVIPKTKFYSQEGGIHLGYAESFHFVTWHVDADYDSLKSLPYQKKSSPLLTILSHKRDTPGQRKRTDFVLDLSSRYPDVLDIYGTFSKVRYGLKQVRNIPVLEKIHSIYHRLRGHKQKLSFNKLTISLPYHYQLVMENSQETNYFSEKFADAILSWNIPIYWGCPNIHDFFPTDCYHNIDIADPDAFKVVNDIVNTPPTSKQIEALTEARQLILDKYNLFPALDKYLSQGKIKDLYGKQ